MQTEIALSSTDAEYIALSHTLRNTIPLMELLKELQSKKIGFPKNSPGIHCKIFEDNSGAIEIAKVPECANAQNILMSSTITCATMLNGKTSESSIFLQVNNRLIC